MNDTVKDSDVEIGDPKKIITKREKEWRDLVQMAASEILGRDAEKVTQDGKIYDSDEKNELDKKTDKKLNDIKHKDEYRNLATLFQGVLCTKGIYNREDRFSKTSYVTDSHGTMYIAVKFPDGSTAAVEVGHGHGIRSEFFTNGGQGTQVRNFPIEVYCLEGYDNEANKAVRAELPQEFLKYKAVFAAKNGHIVPALFDHHGQSVSPIQSSRCLGLPDDKNIEVIPYNQAIAIAHNHFLRNLESYRTTHEVFHREKGWFKEKGVDRDEFVNFLRELPSDVDGINKKLKQAESSENKCLKLLREMIGLRSDKPLDEYPLLARILSLKKEIIREEDFIDFLRELPDEMDKLIEYLGELEEINKYYESLLFNPETLMVDKMQECYQSPQLQKATIYKLLEWRDVARKPEDFLSLKRNFDFTTRTFRAEEEPDKLKATQNGIGSQIAGLQ